MPGREKDAPPADRIDVDKAVELMRRRAGIDDLRRAALLILRDYKQFLNRLDFHLRESSSERMVATHKEVEDEVVPFIRDTVFDDPARFEKFCKLFLDSRGIKWREERNLSEEVTLF